MNEFLRFLLFAFVALTISSCSSDDNLDGVWALAYEKSEGGIHQKDFRTLLDFNGKRLTVVRIGDFDRMDFDAFSYENLSFEENFSNLSLTLDGQKFTTRTWKDSLVLESSDGYSLLFLRLDPQLKKVKIPEDYFNDSFAFVGTKFSDSIDFVNDSTFVHTGTFNESHPATTWNILKYNGYQFFCIHESITNFLIMPSLVTPEAIHFWKKPNVILKRTTGRLERSKLFGLWKAFKEEDMSSIGLYLFSKDLPKVISISNESISYELGNDSFNQKWNITHDGQRIYFDNIFDEYGSWRILDSKGDTLILKFVDKQGMREVAISYFKE